MAMNIKNPEAERLAKEVAAITGENLTTAIVHALRERHERLRRERGGNLAHRLVKIGDDCARHLKKPFRTVDHGALLYDENGLPQ